MIAVRSPVIRRGVRAVGPLALLVAVYLLFAGHNRPGGGFAAGLVIGAVISLRAVAELPRPTSAVPLIAFGFGLAAAVALAPVVGGGTLLDQVVVEVRLPVLGTLKSGTALVFDVGVASVVVGLVVGVLDGLGGEGLMPPGRTSAPGDDR